MKEKTAVNKKKKVKVISIIIIVAILTLSFSIYRFSRRKASWISDEKHLERISASIQKNYIDTYGANYVGDKDGKFTDYPEVIPTAFQVYPMYDANDEMRYCLVEFEPYGYTYVRIKDSCFLFYSYKANRSLYTNARFGNNYWFPCDNTQSGYVGENDIETQTFYFNSPFAIRARSDEKYYLLKGHIPAVKRAGTFINLYTNEVVSASNSEDLTAQPYSQSVGFDDTSNAYAL